MNEQHQQSSGDERRRYLTVRISLVRNSLSIPVDAQTLAEFLKLNPHMGAESRNDAKCKAFLGELGMLEHFTRSKEPNLSVLTFRNHPTHWVVGMLWSGYPKPDQNGYRIFCLPKQNIPEEVVKGVVQDVLEDYGGYDQEDGVIQLSPDWRKEN